MAQRATPFSTFPDASNLPLRVCRLPPGQTRKLFGTAKASEQPFASRIEWKLAPARRAGKVQNPVRLFPFHLCFRTLRTCRHECAVFRQGKLAPVRQRISEPNGPARNPRRRGVCHDVDGRRTDAFEGSAGYPIRPDPSPTHVCPQIDGKRAAAL